MSSSSPWAGWDKAGSHCGSFFYLGLLRVEYPHNSEAALHCPRCVCVCVFVCGVCKSEYVSLCVALLLGPVSGCAFWPWSQRLAAGARRVWVWVSVRAALQQDPTASEPNKSKADAGLWNHRESAPTMINKTKSDSKVGRRAGKIHKGAFIGLRCTD